MNRYNRIQQSMDILCEEYRLKGIEQALTEIEILKARVIAKYKSPKIRWTAIQHGFNGLKKKYNFVGKK